MINAESEIEMFDVTKILNMIARKKNNNNNDNYYDDNNDNSSYEILYCRSIT